MRQGPRRHGRSEGSQNIRGDRERFRQTEQQTAVEQVRRQCLHVAGQDERATGVGRREREQERYPLVRPGALYRADIRYAQHVTHGEPEAVHRAGRAGDVVRFRARLRRVYVRLRVSTATTALVGGLQYLPARHEQGDHRRLYKNTSSTLQLVLRGSDESFQSSRPRPEGQQLELHRRLQLAVQREALAELVGSRAGASSENVGLKVGYTCEKNGCGSDRRRSTAVARPRAFFFQDSKRSRASVDVFT